jgi:leucyl-tRNA synthetase
MTGMEGQYRFLRRVYQLVYDNREACKGLVPIDGSVGDIHDDEIRRAVHHAIREVTLDIDERETLNTAIARMMELYNALADFASKRFDSSNKAHRSDLATGIGVLLRLLSPYAPHITEECWEGLGNSESIFKTPWPGYDDKFLMKNTMTIAIQVMGKLRDTIEAPVDIDKAALEEACRTEKVMKYLEGKEIVKVIVVPKKLVNFVVK